MSRSIPGHFGQQKAGSLGKSGQGRQSTVLSCYNNLRNGSSSKIKMALKMALTSLKSAVMAPMAHGRPSQLHIACAKTSCSIPTLLPASKTSGMTFLFPTMPISRNLMLKAARTTAERSNPEYEAYVQGNDDLAELCPCGYFSSYFECT